MPRNRRRTLSLLTRPLDFPEPGPAPVQRPHLLFVNRSYWPDTEATGQLLTELTTDLAEWFDVTVVAGHPNHIDEAAAPTDIHSREYRGVTVHRVWHSRFSKHSSLGRLANLTTFTLSAWRAARQLRRRPDVIIVQTDPFFLPCIGRKLQRHHGGCPLVCYLQDLYPDIAVAVGKIREGRLTRFVRQVLFKIYQSSQKVIVLSTDMKRRCEEYGVPSDKLDVVANWADTNQVRPVKTDNVFRKQHNLENRFVVMYSGNMGLAHDLETLLDAAVLLRDRSDLEWVFVGDGVRRKFAAERAEQLGLEHVRFLPYQPKSVLAHSLSAADVHLVSVRPGASACVMPSKLYGILASGTPTVAVVEPETELSDLINDHEVGFTCVPGDAEALAERIRELADNPDLKHRLGLNARNLAEAEYSRTGQTSRIAQLLCELLGNEIPESLAKRLHPSRVHQTPGSRTRGSRTRESSEIPEVSQLQRPQTLSPPKH
ncbi:MAG: glycosyltransferase family 4 protein [Planctomycetes bacterium]|nr:glycosyltransferase family 4 protein [Planctomycetota bacterium]